MEKDQGLFGSEGYVLGKLLATDSWGELYRAVYKPLAREALFRRLPEAVATDRAAWELASAEIQAWARLDHRGILQVLDWGISPGENAPEAYLATEMPGGRILKSILEEPGSRLDRPPGWPDSVFAGLLSSVEAARRWGVLHLGLRPECIWVSAAGEVTVSDFGLWYVTSRFPSCGRRRDPFLAPEQAGGGAPGAATDVYSLGMLFIALRCGCDALEPAAAGSLPAELGEHRPAIAKCLSEQPLARHRTAGELADALGLHEAVTGGESAPEHFRDCPVCRLKSEIRSDSLRRSRPSETRGGESVPLVKYAWAVALALAVACAIVWWFALR